MKKATWVAILSGLVLTVVVLLAWVSVGVYVLEPLVDWIRPTPVYEWGVQVNRSMWPLMIAMAWGLVGCFVVVFTPLYWGHRYSHHQWPFHKVAA